MKRILLIVVILLAVLGIGAGAGLYFLGGVAGVMAKLHGPPVVAAPPPQEADFFDLPEMLVTLDEPGMRILKISATLQCASTGDIGKLKAYLPRIMDVFQVYIRDLHVQDFQGSENLAHFRAELIARINVAVAPAKITDILFHELIVE